MTLDQFEADDGEDADYGHLVAHLIEQDTSTKDNDLWTRVFSRDDLGDNQLATPKIGPDLIYDKSLREAHGEAKDYTGEVLFSPF